MMSTSSRQASTYSLATWFGLLVAVLCLIPKHVVVQAADTESNEPCKAMGITENNSCNTECQITRGGKAAIAGAIDPDLSGFQWFCQCDGSTICSDYPIERCAARKVTDQASCEAYCGSIGNGFEAAKATVTGSDVDCECGDIEFCTDTFFATPPGNSGSTPAADVGNAGGNSANAGGNSGTTPGAGAGSSNGEGTVGIGPVGPPACATIGVRFGFTTDDCKAACGGGLANSGDTLDFPETGELDQGIYRVTWCTCDGSDLCRTRKLIVDPTQDTDCQDILVDNSASCLQSCFPQGYEYNFDNGFFVCSCKINNQLYEKCDQIAPDGAVMMSRQFFNSWLYGTLLVVGMLNLLH